MIKKLLEGPKDANQGFKWLTYIVGAALLLTVIFTFVNAPKLPQRPVEERFFSGYDGSHGELESRIKATMNDPDSYEHVETRYRKEGGALEVITKFRGKNGFGGIITKTAEATISSVDGHIIDWKMLD